jgi:hypothetical protein
MLCIVTGATARLVISQVVKLLSGVGKDVEEVHELHVNPAKASECYMRFEHEWQHVNIRCRKHSMSS